MSIMKSRIAKLEQNARGSADPRSKLERDVAYCAWVDGLLPVASICSSPTELAAHIKSMEQRNIEQVVELDLRKREDAIRASFARIIWERARTHE